MFFDVVGHSTITDESKLKNNEHPNAEFPGKPDIPGTSNKPDRPNGPIRPSSRIGAYCDLSAAMIIVGSSAVVGKFLVAEMPVFLSQALRFSLAFVIMFPLLKRVEGGLPRMSLHGWGVTVLQALGGVVIFNACLLYGLKYTSAVHAGIITSITPATMGIAAWLLFRERLGIRKGMGVGLAVGGVMSLTWAGGANAAGVAPILGDLLVLGAVTGETVFLLLRKLVREPISSLGFSTIMNLVGMLIFLVPGSIEAAHFDFASVSITGWLAVLYSSAALSVAAYLFWFRGVVQVQGSVAGIFTGLMPLSAVGLSYLVLGEPFAWTHLVGGVLVIGAIICIARC